MQQTTRAIILRKFAYGEADLIVTFFGREEGRLSGIAKNARASQKRFGGALELGSIVDLRYATRHASDLVRIEDSHVNAPTIGVMRSLERIAAMSKALELALAFLQERQSAPDKFDLLAEHITALAKTDPTPSSLIAFELKWLSFVGYEPALERCMSCGTQSAAKEQWSFSMDHGGIFCNDCARPGSRRMRLGDKTLQGLQSIVSGNDILLDQGDNRVIQELLAHYVQNILGRPLQGRFIAERW